MGSDGADGTETGLRFTFSDCFLLKLHCGDALSGANYQFADGAHRFRGMLSGKMSLSYYTLFFFFRRPLPFGGSPLEAYPCDQRGIEPPPAVCPRRQERRPTN